jgi:hypothetical protein
MKCVTVMYDAIVTATDASVLLRIGDAEEWIPFRYIEDVDDRDDLDDSGEIEVAEWIAIDRGLV